jgi:Tol biopolymer transport system component
MKSSAYHPAIVQLTSGNYNHDLDNNDNFSPDGKWLVYDTRTAIGGTGGSPSIFRRLVELPGR